jgi:hypothetical protein
MNIAELFEQVGLAFVIIVTLFMLWFRDWKAAVSAGLIFAIVVLGNSIISFYISYAAGSIFILFVVIVLVLIEYRQKPT